MRHVEAAVSTVGCARAVSEAAGSLQVAPEIAPGLGGWGVGPVNTSTKHNEDRDRDRCVLHYT